jgi:hypothetical protein
LVQLVHFSPVGFGRVVFWSSCRLVELSFGRVGFGRPVGGRVVGGRVDGLPSNSIALLFAFVLIVETAVISARSPFLAAFIMGIF